MDLVTRIKYYMNSQNIGSSQFADACDIPRPTLSQILNGRNKKISDEIIRKIHQAYPDLSILWLMFGEGEMQSCANNGFSEAQNVGIIDFNTPQAFDNHDSVNDIPDVEQFSQNYTEKENVLESNLFDSTIPLAGNKVEYSDRIMENVSEENNQAHTPIKSAGGGIAISPDNTKRIVNIMVFYSDNSFESFVPAEP